MAAGFEGKIFLIFLFRKIRKIREIRFVILSLKITRLPSRQSVINLGMINENLVKQIKIILFGDDHNDVHEIDAGDHRTIYFQCGIILYRLIFEANDYVSLTKRVTPTDIKKSFTEWNIFAEWDQPKFETMIFLLNKDESPIKS